MSIRRGNCSGKRPTLQSGPRWGFFSGSLPGCSISCFP
nr:MAG TPA: hypothetical protein [Caudoviricetes sp.]